MVLAFRIARNQQQSPTWKMKSSILKNRREIITVSSMKRIFRIPKSLLIYPIYFQDFWLIYGI